MVFAREVGGLRLDAMPSATRLAVEAPATQLCRGSSGVRPSSFGGDVLRGAWRFHAKSSIRAGSAAMRVSMMVEEALLAGPRFCFASASFLLASFARSSALLRGSVSPLTTPSETSRTGCGYIAGTSELPAALLEDPLEPSCAS